jgi:hypothetical protein
MTAIAGLGWKMTLVDARGRGNGQTAESGPGASSRSPGPGSWQGLKLWLIRSVQGAAVASIFSTTVATAQPITQYTLCGDALKGNVNAKFIMYVERN